MLRWKGIAPALGALLLWPPAPARAFDCEFYQTCCLQLVEAYREAGVSGARLQQFEATCYLHHSFSGMPGTQLLFCLDAWEAMSREAWQHYQDGRIGFYPESCMADPMSDPDDLLEPDPAIPVPEPEPGE